MADIEQSLYTYLSTNAGVSALVSTRIYPIFEPQDAALPCIAYQVIGAVQVLDLAAGTTLTQTRFQLTVTASTYTSAKAVRTALKSALNGYKGVMGMGGVTVYKSQIVNEIDGYAMGVMQVTVRMDVSIWWCEV